MTDLFLINSPIQEYSESYSFVIDLEALEK